MKKLIAIAAVALVGVNMANAKLVRSRTFGEKAKSPTEWIIRTGLSFNNATGSAVKEVKDNDEYSLGCKVGWDVSAAFNKPMGSSGLYWGMEFGLGSRGASLSTEEDDYDFERKESVLTWNVKYSPFTLGYKYSLNDNIRLDAHLGAFVSYDFAGKYYVTETDNNEKDTYSCNINDTDACFYRPDVGIQFGVGIWWKKFNLDLTYQRGFISATDDFYYDDETSTVYSSNLMLRIGYAF